MKIFLTAIILSFGILNCNAQELKKAKAIDYVNPFIGTKTAHQSPGARCPFGMLQFGPVNTSEGILDVMHYAQGNPYIQGFGLTHINATGCKNLGSVLIMPTIGEPDFKLKKSSYSNETASPGYYTVVLDSSKIKAEFSSGLRAGISRFICPKGKVNILIDLSRRHQLDKEFTLSYDEIKNQLSGSRTDGGFCGINGGLHDLYFVFNGFKKPDQVKFYVDDKLQSNAREVKGKKIYAFLSYNLTNPDTLEIRTAISYTSIENAQLNLSKEIGRKTFEKIHSEAREKWNQMLTRIEIEDGNETYKSMFYTSLYHTMAHPNILNDVNGDYPAMGTHKKMNIQGRNRYTLFSLWHTYRTLHPFFALVFPEIQSDIVHSLLGMYKESGWLPLWELNSSEKGAMEGDPSLIVINDTYSKGIKDYDLQLAYEAMKHNATQHYSAPQWGENVAQVRKGIIPYLRHDGYIPQDYKKQQPIYGVVGTTMEYNLADWNLAQLARVLGKKEDYKIFSKRSLGYRYFYDHESGFFRSRFKDSTFYLPFDPYSQSGEMFWGGNSGGIGYIEGNAWTFNFFAPHDMQGLINLMGEKRFVNQLQSFFDKEQFSPTKEPDISYPFLFNYVKGEEWRTQKTVSELIQKEYGNGKNGIPENESFGMMPSWLLFSMMGFYPDCPGADIYQLCRPVFDKVTIHLSSKYYKGKDLVIKKNQSEENAYISNVSFNGKNIEGFTVKHSEITEGGSLDFKFRKK